MFFDPFSQGSARFPNVGDGTVDMWTLVLVYDPSLVGFGVFVFGVAQCCSECVCPLEVYLDPSSLQGDKHTQNKQ